MPNTVKAAVAHKICAQMTPTVSGNHYGPRPATEVETTCVLEVELINSNANPHTFIRICNKLEGSCNLF